MKKIIFLLFGMAVAMSAYAVVPADPTDVSWSDCGDETGYSYLRFTLPTVDLDGNPLDIEMMGYRIYTDDDQLFTFNSAVYSNVWGSTTDIYYYNWESGSDIQSNIVYFYRTNADGFDRFFNTRIGVQVFYLNDNFTIGGTSNIVYTELEAPVTELPKPARPEITEWIDYDPIVWPGGCYTSCMLGYRLPNSITNLVADDGTTVLEKDKVSFSLFTDNDQIFTFTPEMFDQVDEPLTQFPCNLVTPNGSVGYWMIDFEGLTNHVDVLAEGGIEADPFFTWRIGIQSYYTEGDQTSASDIYYMEVYPQLQEAKDVTSTSFFADWSCNAENTYMINNFVGEDSGYFLYVVDKASQETVLCVNVEPTHPQTVYDPDQDKYVAVKDPLPGATYTVEGLTPGATYQFYVVVQQNGDGLSYQSVVREVTLPSGDHGYEVGDVNHDQNVSIKDVTDLIDYLLGADNGICTICADVNGDEGVTIGDVTALIDKLLGSN